MVPLAEAQVLAVPLGVPKGAEGDPTPDLLGEGQKVAEGVRVYNNTVGVGSIVKGAVPSVLGVTVTEVQ